VEHTLLVVVDICYTDNATCALDVDVVVDDVDDADAILEDDMEEENDA